MRTKSMDEELFVGSGTSKQPVGCMTPDTGKDDCAGLESILSHSKASLRALMDIFFGSKLSEVRPRLAHYVDNEVRWAINTAYMQIGWVESTEDGDSNSSVMRMDKERQCLRPQSNPVKGGEEERSRFASTIAHSEALPESPFAQAWPGNSQSSFEGSSSTVNGSAPDFPSASGLLYRWDLLLKIYDVIRLTLPPRYSDEQSLLQQLLDDVVARDSLLRKPLHLMGLVDPETGAGSQTPIGSPALASFDLRKCGRSGWALGSSIDREGDNESNAVRLQSKRAKRERMGRCPQCCSSVNGVEPQWAVEYMERDSGIPWQVRSHLQSLMHTQVPLNYFSVRVDTMECDCQNDKGGDSAESSNSEDEEEESDQVAGGVCSPLSIPPTPVRRELYCKQVDRYTSRTLGEANRILSGQKHS